ncbi:hypothetical protein M9Y10_033273 [Tritrichomonas musculus]|uniref:Uncharacterized protein n=1 Tax=Tritrichomonas musculus TaxID=1915356 RepID=A0ABR2KDM9_9EUKA
MTYTDPNGLVFLLNSGNSTAIVGKSKNAKGDVIIPRSIKYQDKEYIIIGLKEDSFFSNDNITSVSFPNDSEVISIGTRAFSLSNIMRLQIPKSVHLHRT